MPDMQTRSHKGKAAPKPSGRRVNVVRRSKQRSSDVRRGAGLAISAEERRMLIARAAYFRAEKRGFAPGGELRDWVEAEAEVLRQSGGA